MSTIRSNKILNNIGTIENITNYDSNLKKVFSPYLSEQIRMKREYQLLDDNISFCYSGEDLLDQTILTIENKQALIDRGYEEISENKYSHCDYNSVYDIDKKAFGFKTVTGEKINYFDGAFNHKLSYIFEDNLVVFFDEEKREKVLEQTFEKSIIIKDMKVINGIIHFYIHYHDNYYIIATDIGFNFANTSTKFKDIECFYKIKLSHENFGKISNYERNEYHFISKDMVKRKITLGKLYYFNSIDNKYIYFTHSNKFKEFKYFITKENIQVEHLFLYDLTGLFGISDLNNSSGNKLVSTKTVKSPNQLFKFKFGDNTNGFINYNDFGLEKSYKINYNDSNFFKVYGNLFFDGMTNGEYTLHIRSIGSKSLSNKNNNLRLELLKRDTSGDFIVIKDITTEFSGNITYFSNLCIEVNGTYDLPLDYSIVVNVTHKLPIALSKDVYNLDKPLNDNPQNYEYKLQSNKIIQSKNRLKNPMVIDYTRETPFLNPFYIYTEKGEIEKTEIGKSVVPKNFFRELPSTDNTNYYVNFKKTYEKEVTISSVINRFDVFNIQRLKFSLNISSIL